MTDDQIKHLVDKFLSYRFPEDIQPDGGLSIRRVFNVGTPHEFKATPSGTNLLNAAQATEMVRHMTAGFPHTAGAIAASDERDGWMPIETAPKTDPANMKALCFLGWCPDDCAADGGDQRVIWWEPHVTKSGVTTSCWWSDRDTKERPTHWRPLPTPPASKG